jgi:hypothetical protein
VVAPAHTAATAAARADAAHHPLERARHRTRRARRGAFVKSDLGRAGERERLLLAREHIEEAAALLLLRRVRLAHERGDHLARAAEVNVRLAERALRVVRLLQDAEQQVLRADLVRI